jgi:hypothetical protein
VFHYEGGEEGESERSMSVHLWPLVIALAVVMGVLSRELWGSVQRRQ